jgi:predicted PurR-regulated permease PerM
VSAGATGGVGAGEGGVWGTDGIVGVDPHAHTHVANSTPAVRESADLVWGRIRISPPDPLNVSERAIGQLPAVPCAGEDSVTRDRVRKAFLLALVMSVTIVFLVMLRSFLVTILMAAIFSGLLYPWFEDLAVRLRSRTLAATVTVLSTLVLVIAPLLLVLGLVVNQAVRVSEDVRPVVERLISDRTYLEQQIERIPGFERVAQYRDEIFKRTGDVVNAMGRFLAGSLSDATQGTVAFIAQFLLFLYTLFFLLLDGPKS